MAKTVLPTNFKDDILNAGMNGKRRYRETTNSDGTVSLEDASVYDQVGSNFGAGQINATNTAVNESADKNTIIDNIDDIAANTKSGMIAGALALKEVNQNLGGFTPVIDATGEITGYKTTVGGADTVFPFSSGASFARMYLGSTSQDEATHYLPIIQLVGSFLSKHSDTGLLVTRDCNATIVLILYTEGGSGVHTSKVMINNAVMLTASPGSLIRTKDIALKKGDIVKSYQQSVKNWYVIGDCYIVAY